MSQHQPQKPRLYANGQPWREGRGQNAPRQAVEAEFQAEYAVVDLSTDPLPSYFLKAVVREFRIRFYKTKTISNYRSAISAFLRWYVRPLNQVTKEDIREFLDLLVTGGSSSSHVSVTLSALRTAFDKFCLLRCTVGLVTPRKPKKLAVVASKQEVRRLIEAARSFRDKLLISVLYATGMRVSEIARLKWSDLDFDRRQVRIDCGKGRKNRYVMLAEHLVPLLRQVWRLTNGQGYLFPGEGKRPDRHLTTRTIERAVDHARQLSKITKHITPHSLRHSFATHLIESGTDIRFIQRLLGHTNLETTSLYTKVAKTSAGNISSPLDQLGSADATPSTPAPVGRLSIKVAQDADATGLRRVALHVWCRGDWVTLPGLKVSEPRTGWITLHIPAQETWQQQLDRLPQTQRQRIEAPEFYEMLQHEVARRIPAPD